MRTARRFSAIGFLLSSLAFAASTADAPALRADLARYYFTSAEAEREARTDLSDAIRKLNDFRAGIDSGPHLLEALQSYEAVLRIFRKHEAYLHISCALDRTTSSCRDRADLGDQIDAGTAFLPVEIGALPADRLTSYCAEAPGLRVYTNALSDMRREAGHTLPAREQSVLDSVQSEMAGWQYDLYEAVLDSIPFGSVQTSRGPRDVIRQRTELAVDPDRKVREEAFRRRVEGFAQHRDLLAFALVKTVEAQQTLAKLHNYDDAPSRAYSDLYQNPTHTRALLESMERDGSIVRRFERIRAADVGLTDPTQIRPWDLDAPISGVTPSVKSMSQLAPTFEAAFSSLGSEYKAAFRALLKPENGRADIPARAASTRYAGGFSVGFPGSTSMLFVGHFDGTFKSLSIIAHEGGHAVHRALMNAHGVRPVDFDGPGFVFESIAAFNELLLADYLAGVAPDAASRRYYLEQWMRIKGLDAFFGAQDAVLEQAIYDGVDDGSIRNAASLDELTLRVDSEFSSFPVAVPEMRDRWSATSLMYEDPLYNINYVYGGLLALKYFQLWEANREEFAPRFLALLENGFDAPPNELLKRFLGIDLADDSLIADDLTLLDKRLAELEDDSR